MKYFILGALASGFLLYGISMLYGATGSLDLTEIARVTASGTMNKSVLVFGLVFLVAGLAFKLGVVPFHMWVPDVYHGAPASVTLLVSTAPELASFALVMRLLTYGLGGNPSLWVQILTALAGLDTWVVGCFLRSGRHWTHADLSTVIDWVKTLKPRRTVLTHMGTEMDWAWMADNLPAGIEAGYDGQVLVIQ